MNNPRTNVMGYVTWEPLLHYTEPDSVTFNWWEHGEPSTNPEGLVDRYFPKTAPITEYYLG